MAKRSVVLLVVWVAFLGDLLVGAGLVLSRRESLRIVGLAMVLTAAAAMVGLTLAFYVQNRRQRRADPQKTQKSQKP